MAQPLWIFVGSSVTGNAVRTSKGQKTSDVITILEFLKYYLGNKKDSIESIKIALEGKLTSDGENLFGGRFGYLNSCGLTAEEIYEQTLSVLFNAGNVGGLSIENLVGAKGELVLRIGDNPPFGLIYVGDDTKLKQLCQYVGFDVYETNFSGSMFQDLNSTDSDINLLIGSKKFSEGWSSWRVSTMGLMNVGRGEGAQIVQLFGRGVRLKGLQTSLKRSSACRDLIKTRGLSHPEHIQLLETLSIFGIRSDYMSQFRNILEHEGIDTAEKTQILLPINTLDINNLELKMIRVKTELGGISLGSGTLFHSMGPIPILSPPNPDIDESTKYLATNKVVLNWYPKLTSIKSRKFPKKVEIQFNEGFFSEKHTQFLDFDQYCLIWSNSKANRVGIILSLLVHHYKISFQIILGINYSYLNQS